MTYTPPDTALPVILESAYTPPELSEPIILCAEEAQGGILLADLPTVTLPSLQMELSAEQAFVGQLSGQLPAVSLPSITLQASTVIAWATSLSARLPAPAPPITARALLTQRLDLPENDGTHAAARHKISRAKSATPLSLLAQDGDQIRIPLEVIQQHGHRLASDLTLPSTETLRIQAHLTQQHKHGLPLLASTAAPHAEAIRSRESTRTRHAHGIKRKAMTGLPHAETVKRHPSLRMAEQQALPAAKGLGVGHHNAWPTGTRLEVRWAQGMKPAPGYWWPAYKTPGLTIVMPCDGSYTPRPLHCEVILGTAYPPQPPCPIEPGEDTIIIPVREAYHVINTLTLTELDGTPVAAEDFSASIDADSWTWSWSTRIPASALAQVRPDSSTRVELIATINGEPLRVLVENIQRERRFGESWLRVSGRGRAAFLADPLAPVVQYTNETPLTAQQALLDAMKINGVSIGWTLDWQIEDWQIPAGIWSHSGTWIDAAKRIAEAGGAYVQSHDTDQVLRILPRYPLAPWSWSTATPDIQLPEDAVEVEGIEWQEKPDYNAVWVHGGDQGRLDRIITGSSGGTNPAPTIVDELATDPVMTRQRGLALLGDTGKQASISLRLPVLPETGMIRPGTLIEYLEQGNTRRGLVRSLSINHSRPELWQTIGVETHE